MGSNEDSANSSEPVVHKFGDEELSDVTLVVGGEEFKCNKMFLATRSSYFNAMFFSNFKEKDQDKISIEADPVAFKRIMQLLYTGLCNNYWTKVLRRHTLHSAFKGPFLWKQAFVLLNLADQFDVLNYVVPILENYFILYDDCISECPVFAAKLLIALKYDMKRYKKKSTATKTPMLRLLEKLCDEQPDFSLDSKSLQWILKMK